MSELPAPAIPAVTGVLETALYVADLERAEAFFTTLFGFEKLLRDECMCALNVAGRAVLLLFRDGASNQVDPVSGRNIPAHDGRGPVHIAFSIPLAALGG